MEMREIHSHKVNPANDQLAITVLDEPGAGGANHEYMIDTPHGLTCRISFQNGPIAEKGVNGVTQEALLAVVIDRLESFQAGPFASVYNAKALEHVKAAQESLLDRTRERMVRGVEGRSVA
jgi:hypothetical protein